MKTETRELCNYWELSKDWQKVAQSNNDDYEEQTYIKPLDHHIPIKHILWDLCEAMRQPKGSDYHAIISVSNNSALGLNFSDCMEQVIITFL